MVETKWRFRAKAKASRAGENPQVIISLFEECYGEWRACYDALDDEDKTKIEINEDFKKVLGDAYDEPPEDLGAFRMVKADQNNEDMKEFTEMLCPKWFEVEGLGEKDN